MTTENQTNQTPKTRRAIVKETLISLKDKLDQNHIIDLAFSTASPEYIKQEFYRAAKDIGYPITVTITNNGVQIKKRLLADLDFNISSTFTTTSALANQREPEPNDLD